MTSQSPEFSQFRRRLRMSQRSRSAANVDPSGSLAVTSDPDAVVNDVDNDFDWDTRRRSANSALSSRLSTWFQQRLMTFGAASRSTYDHELRTAVKPPPQAANIASDGRPHTTHGCRAAAATASSLDGLHVTPSNDCKCVSCPELIDSPFNASASTGNKERCEVADKPPRHQTVRKTCSDTEFKPAAATPNTGVVIPTQAW